MRTITGVGIYVGSFALILLALIFVIGMISARAKPKAHPAPVVATSQDVVVTGGIAVLPHIVNKCRSGELLFRVNDGLATAVCARVIK